MTIIEMSKWRGFNNSHYRFLFKYTDTKRKDIPHWENITTMIYIVSREFPNTMKDSHTK